MPDQTNLQPIQSTLDQSTNIFIAISNKPNHDIVASALSLFLVLKEAQKNVFIGCSSPMVVEHSRLVGLDKIKEKVGNKNLVVAFEYIKDSIEKVSYNVTGNKFNLVVQPKEGEKPLDASSVSYSYSGMSADLIFIFGAKSLNDLGDIYTTNVKEFEKAHTVSINKDQVTPFAQTTISDKNSGSVCEITTWFIEQMGYKLSTDTASNLLSGIDRATNKFSSPTTPASSFVTAGKLMQLGAVRHTTPERPKIPNLPDLNTTSITPPTSSPTTPPLLRPMSPADSDNLKPEEKVEDPGQNSSPDTPQDWLEPKIYRGSTKI